MSGNESPGELSDFSGFLGHTPAVYVESGNGPRTNTLRALRNIDLSVVAGKRVLLKPNVGRVADAASGVVTNPDVVGATIDAFTEAGAVVAVGESPITGIDTMAAFERCGIARAARTRNCPLIDMDVRQPVTVPVPRGDAIDHLKVCADLFDFDIIVSIPVMKMHMHTGVTLSIKNMKGCLWRRSKVELHMLPRREGCKEKMLNVAIADMASVLKPHLAIIDGTVGLEGLGPSAGEPKPLDAVVVSAHPFGADAVACTLMDVDPFCVPHLRLGAQKTGESIDIDDYTIQPATWRRAQSAFAPAPSNLSITFPDITVLDNNSCSACQSTVLLLLKRYGKQLFDYFPDADKLTVAIGKGNESVPPHTLCIGNCTAAHKRRGIFVPGCPPVSSAIIKALEKRNAPPDATGR